jgi:hypothetical protein
MNDAYYTETGERPDLAAIEVNPPEGYIGEKILPVVPVTDKTGVVYYATVKADAAAQTGRSAGAAPTASAISASNTTFTAAEAVKRGTITPDEAKQMGGIAKADMVGAKWAKRQVMNYKETDIAALIMQSGADADASFDPTKVQTQVQTALQSVRLYEGKTALIAATITIKGMLQAMLADSVHGAALARLVTGASGVDAVRGLSVQAWKQALAIFFGVDEVMAGDDTIWGATAIAGRFAIAKLDDGTDELSHKWKPVIGKCFQFMPDGKNPWVIQSVADRVNVNNLYDAYLWYDAVLLNAAGVYVFDGVAVS